VTSVTPQGIADTLYQLSVCKIRAVIQYRTAINTQIWGQTSKVFYRV
jgi:hypothetical protein